MIQQIKKVIMRKIAIFTDIHGLYEPLEAIIKDIKQRGIKEVYSLGDNIGIGPNPKEVMDLLLESNVSNFLFKIFILKSL